MVRRQYGQGRLLGRNPEQGSGGAGPSRGAWAEAWFIRGLLNDAPARLYQARAGVEVIAVIAFRDPAAASFSLRNFAARLANEPIGDAVVPMLDDTPVVVEIPVFRTIGDRVLQE